MDTHEGPRATGATGPPGGVLVEGETLGQWRDQLNEIRDALDQVYTRGWRSVAGVNWSVEVDDADAIHITVWRNRPGSRS